MNFGKDCYGISTDGAFIVVSVAPFNWLSDTIYIFFSRCVVPHSDVFAVFASPQTLKTKNTLGGRRMPRTKRGRILKSRTLVSASSLTVTMSFFTVIFFLSLFYFVVSHEVGIPEHPTIKQCCLF